VLPIPRVVPVDLYLDYLTNRTMPDLDTALLQLLENLWTASAQVGTDATAAAILQAVTAAEVPLQTGWTAQRCASCRVGQPLSSHAPRDLAKHVFMISTRDFMDAWTFNVRDVHKCCVGVLVPDGRIIPFCAYNACGYRQQVARGLAQAVPVVTP
jgi:uncharacterized radical SAM superfamily Fe-S cluster-containing enzyme